MNYGIAVMNSHEIRDSASLLEALARVSRSYEKTSMVLTLCLEDRFRHDAASQVEAGRVLDVGSGPGSMVRAVRRLCRNCYIVALEPLPQYIYILGRGLQGSHVDVVQGFIEYMPFRAGAFDSVVSGFMLRDVMDLGRALAMMALAGRRVVILDFWRPDSLPALVAEIVYMFLIMILVAAIAPRDLWGYMKMIKTVFRVPRLGVLVEILSRLGVVSIRCWAQCILFRVTLKSKLYI